MHSVCLQQQYSIWFHGLCTLWTIVCDQYIFNCQTFLKSVSILFRDHVLKRKKLKNNYPKVPSTHMYTLNLAFHLNLIKAAPFRPYMYCTTVSFWSVYHLEQNMLGSKRSKNGKKPIDLGAPKMALSAIQNVCTPPPPSPTVQPQRMTLITVVNTASGLSTV